ncbi:MAG: hypothetical protein A2007_03345 [Verrucomicrobia bacterium GWC2_42_7]|nr:MAG: hypothetical protein A2007_03345 [Verrucomicrobia bacterium GWC2_42_7]
MESEENPGKPMVPRNASSWPLFENELRKTLIHIFEQATPAPSPSPKEDVSLRSPIRLAR